jgi:hypothetical protein
MGNDYIRSVASSNNNNYIYTILKIANDKKYTLGLKNIFETDRYICVDFYKDNLFPHAILLDKEKNVSYYIDGYASYTPNFGQITYSFDNTFVKIWTNDNIKLLKTDLERGDFKDKYPADILNILDHYNEDDNPILLLYTM